MRKNIFLISLALLLIILPFSYAQTNVMCVSSSVTDISPSSVNIGDEFTVGIQIENCGTNIPDFVSFELISVPENLVIQESLLTEISKLYYGNSERFLIYHMKTTDNANPGTYLIKTRLTYGSTGNYVVKDDEIRITVIGERGELNIASMRTRPVLPIKDDVVELTLRVENIGKGTAKSVIVYAEHPFQGNKQSFIGSLKSNEEGPAIFTFIADNSGTFEIPITIKYQDDFGEKEVRKIVEITILEKEKNIGIFLLILVLILLLILGIYFFLRTKKAKDKVIHQLLKGGASTEKSKK